MKNILRRLLPSWFISIYRSFKTKRLSQEYYNLPVKQVFERIYAEKLWGNDELEFNSGSGSVGEAVTKYVDSVRQFINTNDIKSVVDLGCGDFRVGNALISNLHLTYTGIDIVDSLIARNTREYGSCNVNFLSLNIIEDELPDADLCLIRQVLQHLSNNEIQKILAKIEKYKFVLITEHIPTQCIKFNCDKPHGPDVRLYYDSGVFIDKPPFDLNSQVLLESEQAFNGKDAVLRTLLIRQQ